MGNLLPVQSSNTNNATKFKICSNLTVETPEQHFWRRCGVSFLFTFILIILPMCIEQLL